MSIYYLHLQAKARTSEEMDGTLPRIASFENTYSEVPNKRAGRISTNDYS